MRTRAVAEELVIQGATPLFIVDDEPSAETLRAAGFEARAAFAHPAWCHERAAGAWLDGFVDWSHELLLEDERGTVNLIVPPPVYERHRAEVRTSPLLRAKGRLERREGTINVLVSAVAELRRTQLDEVAPAGHSFGRRGAQPPKRPPQPAHSNDRD